MSNAVTEVATPERRRAIAEGIASDCGWASAVAMRASVLRITRPAWMYGPAVVVFDEFGVLVE
jgi:hypothetical protein